MTNAQRAARNRKLLDQATHTDVYGALYKYVNGKLFHWRCYYIGTCFPVHCWGPITLPARHNIYPIQGTNK